MNNTGKRLAFLLEAAGLSCDREAGRILVDSVTADSREVEPGCLFIALSGAVHNGHDYIREAIGKGCAVVLSEKEPASPLEVPVVTVPDTREALGYIAAAFYGFPAEEAVMIGITGTNGKTTSGWLLESVLKKAGCIPGVIGTVNVRFPGEERHGQLTTPGPLELQKILREMVDRGVSHVVMEVSSHALQQKRVNGLNFDLALFTNLSRDHLDYHPDMDAYFEAKKKLFSRYLKSSGTAVIHLETGFSVFGRNDELVENNSTGSRWGEKLSVFLEELNCCRIITCGIGRGEVQAVNPDYSLNGIRAKIITPEGVFYLESSLVGEFNLTNLTGVAGCGFALGLSAEGIRLGLKELKTIPGRLERLDEGPLIFIDYAHTPDALEHVLTTLRPLVEKRLIVVFGCGGDRDKGKRPLMGEVAGRLGDVIVLTSDNPRSEDPENILEDIEKGLSGQPVHRADCGLTYLRVQSEKGVYSIVQDRGRAIKEVIAFSQPGDVVVICGKGHESYQTGRLGTVFFNDRLEAIRALNRVDQTC